MNLEQYFRLILTVIFQRHVISQTKYLGYDEKFNYENIYFYCPRIVCKDYFSISLQICKGNYCSTENGYQTLGHTIKDIEFGFPSKDEELLIPYAECPENITQTVGRIPLSVAQQIVDKHGGIDWDKTISIETFNNFIYGKKSSK